MAASVNKSISGVQTRFTRRSQALLTRDVPQIVTRKSRARNEPSLECLSLNMNKGNSNGRSWRSRRNGERPDHLDTSGNREDSLSHAEGKSGEFVAELDSCDNGSRPLENSAKKALQELRNGKGAEDVETVNGSEDPNSSKEKSKTGKQLKTLVHRLAPTPGFVDKNSLPSGPDLLTRRRVRRLASLNAAAKVNVFFEPSSPLAGRSLTDIMQHSKKVQGVDGECAEEMLDERDGKMKARPRLVSITKSDSNYLESPDLLSEAARTSLGNANVFHDEKPVNGSSLKREHEVVDVGIKRTRVDENGYYTTIITNRRFQKGKEVVDVGLQVELPRIVAADTSGSKAAYCSCRASKVLDIPIQSYISTYSNGTLVSIPITKTHRLTPQAPDKPAPELAQGDLACRSKRIAGLNSRAMLNAILSQERRLPSSQEVAKQRKVHKKGFYEHGLSNTMPSALKIPKINYAATSTSNFSSFGRGKAFGSQLGKPASGSLWQKSGVFSHDGPKRTNGWCYLGSPMVKPYYYNDYKVYRKYYSGIKRNNEVIYVRDSVLLKSGPRRKDLPFVARVSGFWEEDEGPNAGEMMMSVLWYYRPEQTEMGKQPHIHGENEILASRHKDDNSVACIVDKCYVLSYPEYCRYRAASKRAQDSRAPTTTLVPPAQPARPDQETPLSADPKLVFFCRQIYDYRMGRIMKNPLIYNPS